MVSSLLFAMQQTAKIPIPQQTADNISYSGCFTQTQAALPNLSWKAAKNPHHQLNSYSAKYYQFHCLNVQHNQLIFFEPITKNKDSCLPDLVLDTILTFINNTVFSFL